MKFTLASGALALLVGMSATQAAAEDFSGPRIEAHAGYDHVAAKLKYRDSAFPEDNFSEKESTSGVLYGFGIGYDLPMGDGWIVGIHGNVDFADNKRCEPVFGDDAACFKVKRDLEAGGRLGRALSPGFLLYVGGGYVNGKAKISYSDDLDPSNNVSLSDKRDGVRATVGGEVAIRSRVYAKLEYRHTWYDDYDLASGTARVSLAFPRDQIVGGLGIRF